MRFPRSIIKLPVKHFYLYVILTLSTYYTSLQYIKYQQSIHRPVCQIIPRAPQSAPDTGQDVNVAAAHKSTRKHGGCTSGPVYTKWDTCPHCFRPTVYNISTHLRRMSRNSSLFPRAPPAFFQPRKEPQQRLITRALITPSAVCQDVCPYLVAMLPSVTEDHDVRDTIRSTWASVVKTHLWPHAVVNADIQVIFVLANYTADNRYKKQRFAKTKEHAPYPEMARVQAEAARYGDILYFDMQDSYYNLTLKVMSAFKWIRDHCPRAKFVLKVDVDTFVSVPLLLDLLIFNEERLEYSVLGHGYTMNGVVRTGKWSVTQSVWSPGIYPLYASGCAYVMTMSALDAIVEASPYFPIFHIEDVYITGVLRRMLDLPMYIAEEGIFTYFWDLFYSPCELIFYRRVTGTGFDRVYKYNNVWANLMYHDGRCQQFDKANLPCLCAEES